MFDQNCYYGLIALYTELFGATCTPLMVCIPFNYVGLSAIHLWLIVQRN